MRPSPADVRLIRRLSYIFILDLSHKTNHGESTRDASATQRVFQSHVCLYETPEVERDLLDCIDRAEEQLKTDNAERTLGLIR